MKLNSLDRHDEDNITEQRNRPRETSTVVHPKPQFVPLCDCAVVLVEDNKVITTIVIRPLDFPSNCLYFLGKFRQELWDIVSGPSIDFFNTSISNQLAKIGNGDFSTSWLGELEGELRGFGSPG